MPAYEVEVYGIEAALKGADGVDKAFIAAAQRINAVTKDVANSEAGFQRYFNRIEAVKGELVATGNVGPGALSRVGAASDKLAVQFASISRDIDTVGGKSAATFARMANDVLGVVGAIGGGPITMGIALVTGAIGGMAKAYTYVKETAEENAKRVDDYHTFMRESAGKWRQSVDDVTAAYISAGHTPGIQEVNARIAALNLALREQQEIYDANAYSTDVARKVQAGAASNAMQFIKGEIEQLKEKRDILNDEMEQQLQVADAERTAGEQETKRKASANEAAREKSEHVKRILAEYRQSVKEEEAIDKNMQARKREIAKAELAAIEADNRVVFDLALERERLRGEAEATAANERIAQIQNDVLADENASMAKKVAALQAIADIEAATIQSAHVKARAEIEARRQSGDIPDKKSEAELILDRIRLTQELGVVERKRAEDVRVLSVELRKNAEAEEYARINAIANGAALEAYGAAVMVVQPIVGAFTSQIARLGELNAENYRDMLAQAEDLPAIFAKEAQAIAARIAAEAAGKAALSFMDAGREGALAIAQYAVGVGTGNPAAFAAAQGHLTAAGKHMLVGAGYAALAGGGAAGAVAIGLSRGEGGIVGLTREERERQEGGRSAGAPRDTSGSTSSTRATTARGAAKSEGVTYNVYVGPGGLYMPGDDRRARGVIADVNRRNRRDEFELMRDREVG